MISTRQLKKSLTIEKPTVVMESEEEMLDSWLQMSLNEGNDFRNTSILIHSPAVPFGKKCPFYHCPQANFAQWVIVNES